MMQQMIFVGLKLEEQVAHDLSIYWKVAGDTIGIIDSSGYLTTYKGTWRRPMARKSFIALRDALINNPMTNGIVVGENSIAIDFSCLSYNLEWVKELVHSKKLGACDTEEGLKLYEKRTGGFCSWYSLFAWSLKGVTIEKLGLSIQKVVDLSQHQENPDYAEPAKLYFAVA